MIKRSIPTIVIVEQRRPLLCVLRIYSTSIEFENKGSLHRQLDDCPQEPTPCSVNVEAIMSSLTRFYKCNFTLPLARRMSAPQLRRRLLSAVDNLVWKSLAKVFARQHQ